jgi:soluble lytic murein transglycosylase-like protein
MTPVMLWGGAAFLTLFPAQVGGREPGPSAALRAVKPSIVASATIAATAAAAVDLVPIVVSALGECANRLPLKQRWHIARVINRESAEHGYDPLFVTALMQVESGCLPTARGGDALGMVQLLPSTAREVARRLGMPWRGEQTLTEPALNIEIGVHYLRELEEQLGDPYLAVAAYNMGPARVLQMSSDRARRTQYVRKVLLRYERLLDLFA